MNPIIEDSPISHKKERNGSSSQTHKVKDENPHCAVNADMDYAGNKQDSFFDMLPWLRSLAIDHYKEKSPSKNSQKLWNQTLLARKIQMLSLDEAPWRKRKLDQLLQETVPSASDSPSRKSKREKNSNSEGSLELKRTSNGHPLENCSTSDAEILQSLDPQTTKRTPIKLLKSGNNDARKQVPISPLCTPKSSCYKVRKPNTPEKPLRFSDFFDDSILPRMSVPVGPRFQADIPDITHVNSDSEKWLGTRIWPSEGINSKISMKLIGKGKPSSCSCKSRGSIECNKLHISEKRLQLRRDLGTVFFTWKFDEMGEEVSNSWTLNEQKSFSNLVKMNPVSKNMSFWKPAVELFPSKRKQSLVSYYFNVFVLRRMCKQTRLVSSSKDVDSDDDEADEGVTGQGQGQGQSKGVKERYLRLR